MSTDAQSQSAGVAAAPVAGNPWGRLTGWYRSEEFRQAIRVALAMVIVYYISLSMGWDRPHWAGLAVALCSLATAGDSLNKGLLRIGGTLVAGSVTMIMLALFPQDRWYYLLCITIYLGFCTYMMGHSSRWYFWFIAGYVMPLLALSGGPESGTAFDTVVLRLQQTTTGVIVFTVTSVMLWPKDAKPALAETVGEVVEAQRRLLAHYLGLLGGTGAAADAVGLRTQATGAAARLATVVDGAEMDSFEVWETRQCWRSAASDLARLNAALEQWHQGFKELEGLDMAALLPGLAALTPELEARLAAVEGMLSGHSPAHSPEPVALLLDDQAAAGLSRVDRAAVQLTLDELRTIDDLTRSLYRNVADACDYGSGDTNHPPVATNGPGWALDPDRFLYATRTFVAVWIILLCCIYIPDFPMPPGVIPVAAAAGLQLALMPAFPVLSLVVVMLGGVAYAGVFHVVVMPLLSSFIGLGTAIFIAIFIWMIAFGKPQQAMERGIGTSFFVMVISVKNEQTYNFLFVTDFGLMLVLAIVAVWIAGWFPFPLIASRRASRQLQRLFTSCGQLAAAQPEAAGRYLLRKRLDFYQHEVAALPAKIGYWLKATPATLYDDRFPQQLGAFVDNLQVLANNVQSLFAQRRKANGTGILAELEADFDSWRHSLQHILERLAQDPAGLDADELRARLESKLAALEERIAQVLDATTRDLESLEDSEDLYRMLGAYRGVSQAIIDVIGCAARIDWNLVRESRF